MANQTNLQCEGSVSVDQMRNFLSLPTTVSPETYKNHWEKLEGTDIRVLIIKQSPFPNATFITAKAGDTYDLFEKATSTGVKVCKYLFAKWKDGEYNVEFWVTDTPLR